MLEHRLRLDRLEPLRPSIHAARTYAQVKEIIHEAAVAGDRSGLRYKRLSRQIGSLAAVSTSRSMRAYLVTSNEFGAVAVATIVPHVSIEHGGQGQLETGSELDYACRPHLDSEIQPALIDIIRDTSDAMLAKSIKAASLKFRWEYDGANAEEHSRTRTMRKRFKSYMSVSPHEATKLEVLRSHKAFSHIEGTAPLVLPSGVDTYGVTKSNCGLQLFETK